MALGIWCKSCVNVCVDVLAAKRKKVATNSHPLAKPLPEGVVLTDLTKGQWKVGKPIGCGGFGLLYLGQLLVYDGIRDALIIGR